TVFCSTYLRLQMPRVNIHLTISDGLIILAVLKYGGEIALLIAVIETLMASINISRRGMAIKPRTMLVNVYFAALAVFTASKAINIFFGQPDLVLARNEMSSFVWLVGVLAIVLFAVNSFLVAI